MLGSELPEQAAQRSAAANPIAMAFAMTTNTLLRGRSPTMEGRAVTAMLSQAAAARRAATDQPLQQLLDDASLSQSSNSLLE